MADPEPPEVLLDGKKRRIISEDTEWNLELIPPLSCLSVRRIMTTPQDKPIDESAIFDKLPISHRAYELRSLSPSLPLKTTANLGSNNPFWERSCRQRWRAADVGDYDDNWKQMFFQKHLEDIIEHFVPNVTEPAKVLEVAALCQSDVRRLDICQLLPPIQREKGGAESGAETDSEEEPPGHFDFTMLLDKLCHLEELRLSYRVKHCGMNFETEMFTMTKKDCELLGEAVASCRTLKVFKLTRSQVEDEHCHLLVSRLLDHPSLIELDLSHNLIGDRGAVAVAELLGRSDVETLKLYNNSVGSAGAAALGQALARNTTLLTLDLGLNRLGDDGAEAVGEALLENGTLLHLQLGHNQLTEISTTLLSKVLKQNKSLKSIGLAGNQLAEASVSLEEEGIFEESWALTPLYVQGGGKALAEAMAQNSSIVECDVRLAGLDEQSESAIDKAAHNNKWGSRRRDRRCKALCRLRLAVATVQGSKSPGQFLLISRMNRQLMQKTA